MDLTVGNNYINNINLSLARDIVKGDLRDYLFFVSEDPNVSYLVLCADWDHVNMTGDDCTVLRLSYHTRLQGSGYNSIDKYEHQPVTVDNGYAYVVYCSAPDFPHLREGVDYYAYSQTLLHVVVAVFVLFDLIFRRFYRSKNGAV